MGRTNVATTSLALLTTVAIVAAAKRATAKGRIVLSVGSIFLGAAVGGLLTLHTGAVLPLGLADAGVAGAGIWAATAERGRGRAARVAPAENSSERSD
jgi:hypothetical protein